MKISEKNPIDEIKKEQKKEKVEKQKKLLDDYKKRKHFKNEPYIFWRARQLTWHILVVILILGLISGNFFGIGSAYIFWIIIFYITLLVIYIKNKNKKLDNLDKGKWLLKYSLVILSPILLLILFFLILFILESLGG
jgi:hypothetical protein